MKIVISTLFCLYSISALAQSPSIQWEKSYGGTGSEVAIDIKLTTDGGYIVAGVTKSDSNDVSGFHGAPYAATFDCWIVKLAASGSIQWQKCLGSNGDDQATAIQQTTDGGYIVAGYSDSMNGDVTDIHGGYDYWVVKLNDTGGIAWQKSLGGTNNDFATSILQTTDGGYIVAGNTTSNDSDVSGNHGLNDVWIVKLDDTGAIQWQKALGGSGDDFANSIKRTSDGGYIVAGSTTSNDGDVSLNHGGTDNWIVKLSVTGSIQWQKCLGGSNADAANDIAQTTDSGYIVAGYSYSSDGDLTQNIGNSDFWAVKLSSGGNIQWSQSFGGLGNEQAQSIAQTPNGGYIVSGWTFSTDGNIIGNHGNSDYWLVQLSSAGIIQWQKCMGGIGLEQPYSMLETPDGGFVLAGYSDSSSGDVTGNHGISNDFWIAKLYASSGVETVNNSSLITITPNPTSGIISVGGISNANIKAYNTLGQLVTEASNTNNISIAGLPAGIYFVKVFNEQGELLKQDKIMKE